MMLPEPFQCRSRIYTEPRVAPDVSEDIPTTALGHQQAQCSLKSCTFFKFPWCSMIRNVRANGQLMWKFSAISMWYQQLIVQMLFIDLLFLPHKQLERHGFVLSTTAFDALVLKHQPISIHSADWIQSLYTITVIRKYHIRANNIRK